MTSVDSWGFPRIDWNKAPRKQRQQITSLPHGSCTECSYLGFPGATAFGCTVEGEKFIVGPQAIMYSMEDFELAAGMSLEHYMSRVGPTMLEALGRAHALMRTPARTYQIVYAESSNPFDFKQKEIKAIDNVTADAYAKVYVASPAVMVVSVTPITEKV